MRLLSLPDEVLEIALRCLVPPFRSQSLAETYVFTVPVDLLVARLVCRRLHRIATPFAWRRVQLQIASPAAMNYGTYNAAGLKCSDSAALITAAKSSFRSIVRCRFFQQHAELAAHVRVLLVSLEWHAENPELARDALRVATKAMSNLRTVLVWDADVLAIKDIRQLLQRPLLRAVRLMDVDGSAFPAQCEWGAGLKMLHIANSVCPARLVAGAAATLECVSIELARPCPATQPVPTLHAMPWKTLREVALVDCVNEEDWVCFLDGFEVRGGSGLVLRSAYCPVCRTCQMFMTCSGGKDHSSLSWDRSRATGVFWFEDDMPRPICAPYDIQAYVCPHAHKRLNRPIALTELMIGDLAGLEPGRVTQLLHTFSRQPLTRLTLYHVLALDPQTVARVVQAFPTLRHLILLTEGALAPWPGTLDAYAQKLAGLPHLESLAWNNFLLDSTLDAAFLFLTDIALGTLYTRHADTLVKRVHTLRCVKLMSVTDGIVDSIYVRRESNAGGRGTGVAEVRRGEATLHTSSWSTTSNAFEDI